MSLIIPYHPLSSLIKKAWLFILLSLCILNYSVSYAVETPEPIEVNADRVEFFPKEKKVTGIGNVSIDYEDVKLTCDKIIVYTETKDIEAEGHVVLKTAANELKGEKVNYNFGTKKGMIINAAGHSGDWYGLGEKIEILSESAYKVINGYITSCTLPRPHYKITSKSVLIYPDNKVVAQNVLVKIGNMPIGYLPDYHYSMKTDWPAVNVIPGKKKKWGAFALTTYRYNMGDKNALTIRLDERQNWGLGEGFDYKYYVNGWGSGLLKTYYTNQRNVDRNETIKAEAERYMAELRHKWDSEHGTLIMEYHALSDANMTKDFFYREEYEREPSPETYIYGLSKSSEYSLSALARKRVNHFQTVTERLPELRFDLKDQNMFDSFFYFKTDTTFANLNKKTGRTVDDLNVMRFDTYNKLSVPLRIADFLSIAPYTGMRDTLYSRQANIHEDELRAAFYTGIDISTKLAKTYNASGEFLGIDFNKVRHLVTPTIQYQYVHEPSTPFTKLQQFDDIDSLDRTSKFTFGLENKLQTKRMIRGGLSSVDLGYLLITGDYLYKPEGSSSRFSNVKGDLELTLFDWIRIESDTLYNPDTRDFQTWNNDLYIENSDNWRLGFGSRYWQNKETELTSELFYRLNSEWSFRTFARYDLKEVDDNGNKSINKFKDKEISIIKDLHCWILEVSASSGVDGGASIWLVMKLKASPKVPFDFKDYYPHPK